MYYHTHSKQSRTSPEGGIRILYCEVVPKRDEGNGGRMMVEVKETEIKRKLKREGLLATSRGGAEIFNVDIKRLFHIIKTTKIDLKNPPKRHSQGHEKICVAQLVGDRVKVSPMYKNIVKVVG